MSEETNDEGRPESDDPTETAVRVMRMATEEGETHRPPSSPSRATRPPATSSPLRA